MPHWSLDIVLQACVLANGVTTRLWIAVVMPDHVHLIFTPLVDSLKREVFSLARIMKAIKGASSHRINQAAGTHERIWQEESFDRVLRTSEKLDEKIAYILDNPVRRGLVSSRDQYRWVWVNPAIAEVAELRSAGQVRTPAPTRT